MKNLFLYLSSGLFLILGTQAHASLTSSTENEGSCGGSSAVSTIYNFPQEDKPDTYAEYSSFKSAIKTEGAGRLANGNIYTYEGKTIESNPSCNTTTVSASGQCLLPYFSIACDPKSGWKMGDIIYMRSMADQQITLPTGRTIRHPGYFICQDTGGAIKGANRFDFFVGATSNSQNAFTPFKLGSTSSCEGKSYTKLDRGSSNYQDALQQIYALQDADSSNRGGSPQIYQPAQSFAQAGGTLR